MPKYSTWEFYCPDLENDYKIEIPDNSKKCACARIETSQDLNAYIEKHPLRGCILAEVLCYPENVKLVETLCYKSGVVEQYAYVGEPIIQCGINCPFKDCRAEETEYGGYINKQRIQKLAQEINNQNHYETTCGAYRGQYGIA